MSWNTLAGVVGVKEVACRAGDPSWAVAGARWRNPHLRITLWRWQFVNLWKSYSAWEFTLGSGKRVLAKASETKHIFNWFPKRLQEWMHLHWLGRNIWSGAEQFWAEMWQPQEQEMSSLTFQFWKLVQKSYTSWTGRALICNFYKKGIVFLFHLLLWTLGVPGTWNQDCHVFH